MVNNQKNLEYKDNAFDLIRILAAMQVMLGHIAVHLDWQNIGNGILDKAIQLSQIIPGRGVIIFFVISGYLGMASVGNSTFSDYCVKKIARIYPGLWVAVAVNTVIIAVLYGFSPNPLDNVILFFNTNHSVPILYR